MPDLPPKLPQSNWPAPGTPEADACDALNAASIAIDSLNDPDNFEAALTALREVGDQPREATGLEAREITAFLTHIIAAREMIAQRLAPIQIRIDALIEKHCRKIPSGG